MKPSHDRPKRSVPLGGLGTGVVEIGSDGRFSGLTLNNNRTAEVRIPRVPHSFLAVRASGAGETYVRRLQTAQPDSREAHLLPEGGLAFRGNYPQADFRVKDPGAPLEIVWSAFAPVIPYDYDASALPVIFFAVQVNNPTDGPLDVSILLNWQNTCGQNAATAPEDLAPAGVEVVITDAEWDRMTQRREGDNERRLSASSGRVESSKRRTYAAGEIPTNALVFGDAGAVDGNEDGQYCVVSPWSNAYRTSAAIWDPEDGPGAARFWDRFSREGQVDTEPAGALARAGALCNRFTLEPGQTANVEYVVSWFCPRYVTAGADEGNYYANNCPDARAVARIGLDNRKYFHAAVSTWQKRLSTAGLPGWFVQELFASFEVLGANSIHTFEGDFGLLESLGDPRLNNLRDRWFWSMGLLLFFPRLELETVERTSACILDQSSRAIRVSEGIAGFGGGEYVGPGALQVEACAALVTIAYRNYLTGGNLSSMANLAPHLQNLMAVLLAQDKDLDGFPDIQEEAPGLDGHFAGGLNAITAGLWIVALCAYERMARRQQYQEAELYKKAWVRAARNFDRYFWDREHGYYTLYPNAELEIVPPTPLATACHIGQLYPIWVADVLGLDDAFPRKRVTRLMETIEARNVRPDAILMLGAEAGAEAPPVDLDPRVSAAAHFQVVPYLCLKRAREPETPVFDRVQRFSHSAATDFPMRHTAQLALWYLVAPQPAARLNLADRRLELRPARGPAEQQRVTLCTPNGFGEVSMEWVGNAPFHCEIAFNMDIPQEIACIAITLDVFLEDVRCRLAVEDEPVPATCEVAVLNASSVCITVQPRQKLSTPAFTLHLDPPAAEAEPEPNKMQWIPRWFRK